MSSLGNFDFQLVGEAWGGPTLGVPPTWRGSYQIELQPSARQDTYRCPLLARAGSQSQGVQPTVTRPGAHSWPWWHCSGEAPPRGSAHVHPSTRSQVRFIVQTTGCQQEGMRESGPPYPPHPVARSLESGGLPGGRSGWTSSRTH